MTDPATLDPAAIDLAALDPAITLLVAAVATLAGTVKGVVGLGLPTVTLALLLWLQAEARAWWLVAQVRAAGARGGGAEPLEFAVAEHGLRRVERRVQVAYPAVEPDEAAAVGGERLGIGRTPEREA